MYRSRILTVLTCLAALASVPAVAAKPVGDRSAVESMPGLVAFWTFGEASGEPRQSSGTKEKHPLQEVSGPIARVEGGPYSGYAAELNGREYFRIPYAETGDLNISGPEAQVSMFAVVRIVNLKQSRTIAGMWSEGKGANDDTGTRQYALLMNMPTYGGPRQLTPHISSEGGVTRRADGSAFPWCADYAATAKEVPEEEWCTLSFTYDGRDIRAFINGEFEPRALNAKQDRRTDRYFTSEGPAGRDRGMNPYYHGRGIFRYDPVKHATTKPDGGADFTVGARYAVGSFTKEATIGRFGGLAVFNRALNESEIKSLHASANVAALNAPAADVPVNARRPPSDAELRYWLQNLVSYHRFTTEEIHQALGLSADEIQAALKKFDIRPENRAALPKDRVFLLPHPGGRHPRIGFLEGAVDPQRETKVSVFTPWQPADGSRADFVVADVPEALWSNLGLTYLAHTHVPTVWTKQNVTLPPLEWTRKDNGSLTLTRTLPNKISYSAEVRPEKDHVAMKLTLTNGTDQPLTDLRVQNCVMLKDAAGFAEQTNRNKRLVAPYAAVHDAGGTRWIITGWKPNHRTWGNDKCPCLHSDPKFPDCAPGQTQTLRGWLSFYEGNDIDAEIKRIESLHWDQP
jgi:hypothetical protein